MSWLARLSFGEALRWALVWPGMLLGAAVLGLVVVAATRFQGDWAVALPISSTGPVPLWLAIVLGLCVVLFGPSLAFVALWTVARR